MKPWEKYGQAGEPAAAPTPAGPWAKYAPAAPTQETPTLAEPEYTSADALRRGVKGLEVVGQLIGSGYGQLADVFLPDADLGGFTRDMLGQSIEELNQLPSDPNLQQAAQNFEQAPFEGKSFAGALWDAAGDVGAEGFGRLLVEQVPSLVLGGGVGGVAGRKLALGGAEAVAPVVGARAAAGAAAPSVVRGGAAEAAAQQYAGAAAREAAEQAVVQAAGRAGIGAGMTAGQVVGAATGPNIAQEVAEGADLDTAVRTGLGSALTEAAVNAPAGALAPFSLAASPMRNIALQTGLQSAAGAGGAAAGAAAAGRDADPVELMLEAMFGGVTAPIDIAVVKAPEVRASLRSALQRRVKAETGQDISDADADRMIEERIQAAEEASQAQALAPENVAPVIDQATGVNTPGPLGTGMPVAEARQARRNVERELGSLFENETDILRRDDVDVTPEGLQLREGARPAQDPAGRQAQPGTLATYRQAADVLAEAGVEVTPENLDIAVSYLDAGQSPVAAANAFRRAARQGDMREGPTAREQVSDQRRREVAEQAFRLAEARRERAKQDTARVGFGRQGAPTGDYRAGAARGVGDELSPRMAQERAAAGAQPPAGVGEGVQAPRRAVDRVAETLPGGLTGEFLAGDRPPAAPTGGPDARPGRTFDQQTQVEGTVSQPAAAATPALEQQVQQTAAPVDTVQQPQPVQAATEPAAAPQRTLQPGEDLVRSQIEAGPIGRLNLTPEDMQVIADEITARSTDGVTGWLDARGGTMKADVLMDAVAVAEETGQEVHFVNMDIGNLGGLNAFFNDVSAKANKAYRDIADIIRTELEALGPTTFMRTGGDELGAFVQGVSADQVEAAINRAKARLQAYTEAEGMSGIEHAKTKQPGYGVQLHVAHTNVGADATGDTVYSATDARLKQKPETQNGQRQTGPEQQPAAPQDGGAPSWTAEPAPEDGGDAGTVLPERETGTGEAGPTELQRGRDDEVTADGETEPAAKFLQTDGARRVFESDLAGDVDTLTARDVEPPVNSVTPAPATDLPLGSVRLPAYGGDPTQRYIYVLTEIPVDSLRISEPEDGIRRQKAYSQYAQWAREGIEPPPVVVNESENGALVSTNRRRVLAAQDAGVPTIKAWVSPHNPTTGNPLKYGDVAPTVETDADTPTKPSGPSVKFYSGIPLDAIAAKLKELFGGEASNWQRHLKQNSELFTALKEAMQGRRPSVNPIAQAVRWYWQDADQRLRSIADRANMPGVKRVADAFLLRAGDAAGTGRETFHSRMNKRMNKQIDRVEGIRKAFDDAGLTMNDETMLRVRRMLENPSTPRIGKLGDVVRKMETFFQDELAYQRDAGLETGEVKGYLPRVIDKGKISANDATRARFVSAAAKAYKIDNPRMTDAQARELGELRWQREVFGESSGTPGLVLQAGSPGSADFMKGRTLSQKAVEQSGLTDFMVNNPFNLMLGYLQSSAMRAELAKTEIELSDGSTVRIGPNWSNWPQIKQDLVSEGGDAAYEFMPEIEDMVATVSGIKARRHYGRFTRGLSWARTISTLGLLELATLTSLPEPLIGGIRMTKGGSTGGAMMDLTNVVKSSARYGGDAARLLLRLPKRERLQATYDLLHSLGEINANNANAMSVDRFAGGEPASLLQSNLLAAYFRGIRLEQFTNYSVAFAAENSMTFMRQLAQDLAAGGKRADNARIHFRDLNIPAAEIDSFAAFVQSLDGGNPTAGELANAGRNGALYAGAINKFVGESVMRPNAATKPAYAAHPLGASIFQLQSFPFMYTKQVLSRPFRVAQAQAADIGKLEAAYTALPFIVGLTTVVGLQSLLGGMRDEFAELTSGEENPPQSQMFELERALSWAGVFGKVDPILQMISGSRYQKSVFESAAGPTIGRIADGLDTALAAAVNNSPNTTSAERQLWNTSMDLLIEPLLQATASLAPDTGVTGAVMLAARAAGPRALRERGGEALAPREKERLPRYSLAEKLVGADKKPKRDSGRERGREGGRENGRW